MADTESDAGAGNPPAEVWDAVEQLYSLPPAEFVERRSELADQARRAGAKDAAKQIAALRKPTVSAWTVNTLSRTRPQLVADLLSLGDQMRRAQRTLDGSQLRELSRQRRQVLDALAREAFAATGQQPSASVQDEVVATLGAALADPETGAAVQAGSLVKAARADGFGDAARPELALVGAPPTGPIDRTADARAQRETQRLEAARADAEREAELKAERAHTDRVIAAARADLDKARRSEQTKADRLVDLERQLATARQALDEARFAVRRVEAELAEAERRRAELG